MYDQKDDSSEGSLVSNRTMDIIGAVLFLLVSLLVITDSVRLGFKWQEGVGPGPGYFPFYIALIMVGASLINLARAIFDREAAAATFVSWPALRRVLAVFVPLVLFVVAIAFAGIYASAAVFITLFMMYFGGFAAYRALPVGIGVALALFFLFEKWFLVPLPKGPLEHMLGY